MIREDWLMKMIDLLRPDFEQRWFAAAGEDSRLVRLPLEVRLGEQGPPHRRMLGCREQ